ncbi:MAG TPA: hypothetical protein VM033_00570 [Gemmatimonadaceae bacterium]|nr:hypothetical protein [Gemmatimonadaceae bacterium]
MTNPFARALRLSAFALAITACSAEKKTDGTDSVSAGTTPLATPTPAAPVTSEPAAGTTSAMAGAMLDPNSATKEQIAAVPGMSAAAADALIAGRPYADMTAADKVLASSGLDATARKQVYAQLWKPIDLNTASKAEILLIPGVGARMHHEFEEYRPYKDIGQFDRQIGKYVDKTELARLRKYVGIR